MYQVKDGKQVVITCDKCGCRLGSDSKSAFHFYGDKIHDARGCVCTDYNTIFMFDPEPLDNDASNSVR